MGQNKRYGDPLTALDPPAVPTPKAGRVRHVWIEFSAAYPTPYPGVIVDWRRAASGWEAQVAYVTTTETESSLHVVWAPADRLRPAVDPVAG